jgi:hypothetical protein
MEGGFLGRRNPAAARTGRIAPISCARGDVIPSMHNRQKKYSYV